MFPSLFEDGSSIFKLKKKKKNNTETRNRVGVFKLSSWKKKINAIKK